MSNATNLNVDIHGIVGSRIQRPSTPAANLVWMPVKLLDWRDAATTETDRDANTILYFTACGLLAGRPPRALFSCSIDTLTSLTNILGRYVVQCCRNNNNDRNIYTFERFGDQTALNWWEGGIRCSFKKSRPVGLIWTFSPNKTPQKSPI